jgi:hypothetical protein
VVRVGLRDDLLAGHRARFESNPAMAEFFGLTVFAGIADILDDRAR